jgi:hypothetical protein
MVRVSPGSAGLQSVCKTLLVSACILRARGRGTKKSGGKESTGTQRGNGGHIMIQIDITRRECLVIKLEGETVRIMVERANPRCCNLAIDAPKNIEVHRCDMPPFDRLPASSMIC